jgi:hypothetical protein
MTEEEAKTKWCPHLRANGSNVLGVKEGEIERGTDTNCIASDCMMWVSDGTASKEDDPKHYNKLGHCGLVK